MSAETLRIRKPDDFHLHLRQGEILKNLAPYSSGVFARALVMPNISPPVKDVPSLRNYEEEIKSVCGSQFTPLMTFKLIPSLSADTVLPLKNAGAVAGKYYPAGATTNAEDAVAHWEQISPVLERMEQEGMILSIHGEDPLAPALEREQAFLPVLDQIRRRFPRLPIVVEHLSSREGVEWLKDQDEKVAATVTLHHLLFTIEDIIGGALRPHLFCRPLPKKNEDREALRALVFDNHPRVFFGSDSAPHLRERKECNGAAAGAFTAPVLMPLLTGLFESEGKLDLLEAFCSEKGAEFYGLPLNRGHITLEKCDWILSEEISGVVPLFAGRKITWKVL